MKKEFNLGWGESVAVRQAFLSTIKLTSFTFYNSDFQELGYPKHEGDPALVDLTRQILKRQVGHTYKYILITNGATGGVVTALRTYQRRGIVQCWTAEPPYFRLYPDMIRTSGLSHVTPSNKNQMLSAMVYLVDSPQNPTGQFSEMKWSIVLKAPIIWDHTYYNRVYCSGKYPQPDHDVLVGSYGKLIGLNGLRVGWVATNDPALYQELARVVAAEYCGISVPSTKIILETAGKMNDKSWELFEKRSNQFLDNNREEWSKLEKYFGNQPVLPFGMFYYAPLDTSCKKLLEKSGIIWSPGSHLGTDDSFGRFNLGQGPDMLRKAVEEILKNDKIK